MPVIYADVLVALNWLIDYWLLSAVAYIMYIPRIRWRMTLSSLFGGLCACFIFLPPLPSALMALINVAVAAVMVLGAFPFKNTLAFFKRTGMLFIVSALFSGVVGIVSGFSTGELVLVNNGCVYAPISPLALTAFTAISYVVLRLYDKISRKRIPLGGEYRLCVDDGTGVYEGRALHDTGLHLREPFSGASVIVMERKALCPYLSPELGRALTLRGEPNTRVRMVPYRGVGENGLLPAFRPRRVFLSCIGSKKTDVTGVYIALAEDLGRGEYEALVGNDLIS